MDYFFEEELLMLIPGVIVGVPSAMFCIVSYILTSMAIFTVSRRRGLRNAWLAWIPVANCWLLGSISDQYSYVVRGEIRSRRKWLLALRLVKAVLSVVLSLLAAKALGGMAEMLFRGPGSGMRQSGTGPIVGVLGIVMPLTAVNIAYLVIRLMALYNVYRSADPSNAVLYLVLSILFSPVEPFFLFINRDKDLGMPPRKQQTVEAEWEEYEYV